MMLIEKAKAFAANKHGDQKYGSKPYMFHLNEVAEQVGCYEFCGFYNKNVAIAYLHDVLEDTDTSFDELAEVFGESIAHSVACLTDTGNFKEYLSRIRGDRSATVVKMMDRYCNMRSAHGLKVSKKYIDQYCEFRASLYSEVDRSFWKVMDKTFEDLKSFGK